MKDRRIILFLLFVAVAAGLLFKSGLERESTLAERVTVTARDSAAPPPVEAFGNPEGLPPGWLAERDVVVPDRGVRELFAFPAGAGREPDLDLRESATGGRSDSETRDHSAPPDRPPAAVRGEEERAELVAALRGYTDGLRRRGREESRRLGIPLWVTDEGGRLRELVAVIDGEPVYRTTFNLTAAASTRSAALRDDPEVEATGNGVVVGVWDEARVLSFHREFDPGRVVNRHPSPFYSHHSTHVAGTIVAQGEHNSALGIAPGATVESYDWDQSLAEMVDRAPLYPNQPDTVPLANHSYGLVSGWFFDGERDAFVFTGFDRFGRYDRFAYLTDVVAHSVPYQLSVWAAGNHRSGDPAEGDPVWIDGRVVPYDPEIHPPGDGDYKRGFDTLNSFQVAKNVLTVGAVEFSTSSGGRDADITARMSRFSSWGPTDDGRIKPDLVAHGVSVFSPIAANGWYASASGTSMTAPAVNGSLALLHELYENAFPGHALRASTWKALLVHTADDLGNPGPDYRYGWGLVNTRAAAELLARRADGSPGDFVVEDFLNDDRATVEYSLESDGARPLSATLVWTDPPADGPVDEPDRRASVLVNNLHLRIVGPDGEVVYHPYRLDPDRPAAPAETGVNDVDNVLRVTIPAPEPGTYTVRVDFDGAELWGGEQVYSLVATGASEKVAAADLIDVSAVVPNAAPNDDVAVVEIEGEGFAAGTDLRLSRENGEAIDAFGVEVTPTRITARFDLYGVEPGLWDLELSPPDGETHVVAEAFEIEAACHFRFEPEVAEIPVRGGYFSADLVAASPDCPWTLAADREWVLLVTPGSGTGDAEVIYSVAGHQGSALSRTATLRMGNRELLTIEQDGAAPVTLTPGTSRNGFITGREQQFDWKYYRIEVPHMTSGELEVSLESLTGDADLYVRYGDKPTLTKFDCRPFQGGVQSEFCQFSDPEPGTWWIGVNNWDTGRIDYRISAELSIDVLTYEDWVANVFEPDAREDPAVSGPEADPGEYGVPNLLRYALALDFPSPGHGDLPRAGVRETDDGSYSYIEYGERRAATGVTVTVETSQDLLDWEIADVAVETISEDAGTRIVRAETVEPIDPGERRFLRLRLTLE